MDWVSSQSRVIPQLQRKLETHLKGIAPLIFLHSFEMNIPSLSAEQRAAPGIILLIHHLG